MNARKRIAPVTIGAWATWIAIFLVVAWVIWA